MSVESALYTFLSEDGRSRWGPSRARVATVSTPASTDQMRRRVSTVDNEGMIAHPHTRVTSISHE